MSCLKRSTFLLSLIACVGVSSSACLVALAAPSNSKKADEPKLYAQQPKMQSVLEEDNVRIPRVAPQVVKPANALPSTSRAAKPASQVSKRPSAPMKGLAANYLERGKDFCRHGLYKDAVDYFTKATNEDPNCLEAYNRRARAEWQLEQHKEALEDASWAIKQNPDYAEAFCTRSAIQNSLGHYQEAIGDATMARDLNPKLRDAYVLQATAYHNLGQHTEADQIVSQLNDIPDLESAFDEMQSNVDFTPYLGYLQSTVRQNWQPPAGAYGPAVLLFKVHRSGTVSDVRLNATTGDSHADNMAIEAVKRSGPFRQPPFGSPPDFDVYVVLEPGRQQSNQQASAPAPAAPSQKQSINWSGAVNQGLGIMQRCLMFVR